MCAFQSYVRCAVKEYKTRSITSDSNAVENLISLKILGWYFKILKMLRTLEIKENKNNNKKNVPYPK